MRSSMVLLAALVIVSGSASTGAAAPASAPKTDAALDNWNNVQKLEEDGAVRVTQKNGERFFGHVMSVSALELKLELVDASKTIARDDVRLVERFPRSFPRSVSGAAVGVGAALSLSSSSTPQGYYESVAPAPVVLDKSSTHLRNGYYVNAVELVGSSIDRIATAIENTRKTVVVYVVPEPSETT